MSKSILYQFNQIVYCLLPIVAAPLLNRMMPFKSEPETISWSNHCFNQSYDADGDTKLKKWELYVTDELFVRLRKTFKSGRQEYYSFQLKRFNDLAYLGTTRAGVLELICSSQDVMKQTYNDPSGNVDMMINILTIPVKNMEPDRLDSLRQALVFLRDESKN